MAAYSAGPFKFTEFSSVPPGYGAWQNPGLAAESDDSRAACDFASSNDSERLRCETVSSSDLAGIPAGARITGIEVTAEWRGSASLAMWDSLVKLCKSGVEAGSSRATGEYLPTEDETRTYGGPGDLWGWGESDWPVSALDELGVNIRANSDFTHAVASIDCVKVRFYYDYEPHGAVIPEVIPPETPEVVPGEV